MKMMCNTVQMKESLKKTTIPMLLVSEFLLTTTKWSQTLKSIAGFLKFITTSWIIDYLYLEFKSRFLYDGIINCFPLIEFPIVTDSSLDPVNKRVFEPVWMISAGSSNTMYCPPDRNRKEESFLFSLILLIFLGSIKEYLAVLEILNNSCWKYFYKCKEKNFTLHFIFYRTFFADI